MQEKYKCTTYKSEKSMEIAKELTKEMVAKLQQLMDLTGEINQISNKIASCHISYGYYPIFSKNSREMDAIRNITDGYKIKQW